MADIFSILGGISSGLNILEKVGKELQRDSDENSIAAKKYLDTPAYAQYRQKNLQRVSASQREKYLQRERQYEEWTRRQGTEAERRQQKNR